MTTNESFKKRVRARMAETGERYGAARRVLVQQAASRDPHAWVSQPDFSDERVRDATGRGWDDWRELIDASPVAGDGHTAVAAWLVDEHDVDGWWAQAVTVGWERITGRRLPNQMADGTFTAGRSATITADASALRELLLDDDGRADLFPGMATTLRSRPTSKSLRVGMPDGTAGIVLAPKDDGRVTVTVAHTRLSSPEEVAHWKAFWGEWLGALDGA
ncbi:MAG: DUF4287 domain-containing protein [Actinobacteria bacterium]|nr:DUF4287 domain-containing protein [Actinomycetota bacterium]